LTKDVVKRTSAPDNSIQASWFNPISHISKGQAKVSKESTQRSFIAISQESEDRNNRLYPQFTQDFHSPGPSSSSHKIQTNISQPKKRTMPPLPKDSPPKKSASSLKKKEEISAATSYKTATEHLEKSEIDSSMHRERLISSHLMAGPESLHQLKSEAEALLDRNAKSRPNTRDLKVDSIQAEQNSQGRYALRETPAKKTVTINARPSSSSGLQAGRNYGQSFPASGASSPNSSKLIKQLDSMKKFALANLIETTDSSERAQHQTRLALQAREEVCKELQNKNHLLEQENRRLKEEISLSIERGSFNAKTNPYLSNTFGNNFKKVSSSQYVKISDLNYRSPNGSIVIPAKEKLVENTKKISISPHETFNPFQKLTRAKPAHENPKENQNINQNHTFFPAGSRVPTTKPTQVSQGSQRSIPESPLIKQNRHLTESLTFKKSSDLAHSKAPIFNPRQSSELNSPATPTLLHRTGHTLTYSQNSDLLSRSLHQVLQTADKVVLQYKRKGRPEGWDSTNRRRSESLGGHYRDMMISDLKDAAMCLPAESEARFLVQRMLSRTLKFHP
jgi:hypothetical protein